MKKLVGMSVLIVLSLLVLAGCNQGEDEAIVGHAETFINQLSSGDYEAATENLDMTMAEQLTADDLEEMWLSLTEQLGEFIDQEYNRIEEVEEHRVVLITGIFNNIDVTFQVTFNDEEEIAGFYVM